MRASVSSDEIASARISCSERSLKFFAKVFPPVITQRETSLNGYMRNARAKRREAPLQFYFHRNRHQVINHVGAAIEIAFDRLRPAICISRSSDECSLSRRRGRSPVELPKSPRV